ncbi:TPA: hypothetical protein ACGBDE_004622 [Escherichia coli]|uniref:hypothetical protein n=1 Tax=Escherichia coli TaxID=562 RepID=UPI00135FAA28|nr:hypothetical protein [Escherichia coli]KAE9822144.1 hypothetical protein GP646_22710 [Escherichia coli]MWK17901.1 hypothetical protein [Escherichia coli]MWL96597.1 hypothetical protein [Escherichia coli]HDD9007768.1 hypothetical protein [Escherichia coli]
MRGFRCWDSDDFHHGFWLGVLTTMLITMLVVFFSLVKKDKEWEQWAESHCEEIGNNLNVTEISKKFKCDNGNIYIIKP